MTVLPEGLMTAVRQYWGFTQLRPLQTQAIAAVLERRDSLVVLPTGGGKSLCYQAPAVYRGAGEGLTLVVSPLIALMKDQVDSLQRIGIPAVGFNSTQTQADKTEGVRLLRRQEASLVFASPERLGIEGFTSFLQEFGVQAIAIDEAHCISQWGHDFRPEYRKLGKLRELFPDATWHAYTATATQQVRDDIARQLGLKHPDVIVGSFDRPNLTYRVWPRKEPLKQVQSILDRHTGHAAIVYCGRRLDVEGYTMKLKAAGYPAIGYHAGMSNEERRIAQETFINDEAPIIVATVAFGMGIDRPDVRCVIHVAMPKSVENYQQEAGRAGRDGLASECILLHSNGDIVMQRKMTENTVKEAKERGEPVAPDYFANTMRHLNAMESYSRTNQCRHRALVEHFGQKLAGENCGACDICLGDVSIVPDSTKTAQKILSCVARVKESFGIGHVVSVLRGEMTDGIRQRNHHELSTFGLLAGVNKAAVRDWIVQLVAQEVLEQVGDEYPILKLNARSWAIMKGQAEVRLIEMVKSRPEPRQEPGKMRALPGATAATLDADLFEKLRQRRREFANAEKVPAYRILPDAVLIALAVSQPKTLDAMRQISGIGDLKLKSYGLDFLAVIQAHESSGRTATVTAAQPKVSSADAGQRKKLAYSLFRDQTYIEDVAQQLGVSRSTAVGYLVEYIQLEKPKDISRWVRNEDYLEIAAAADSVGRDKLKPIFDALDGQIPYDNIRLVLIHQDCQRG
ncbi:MAG: RecQ family ATP-dependent DNA helicase [Fimbriiglobus sp.]